MKTAQVAMKMIRGATMSSRAAQRRGDDDTFALFADLLFAMCGVLILVPCSLLIEQRAAAAKQADPPPPPDPSPSDDGLLDQLERQAELIAGLKKQAQLSERDRRDAAEKLAAERAKFDSEVQTARAEVADAKDRAWQANEAARRAMKTVPLDLVFVVDTSGSMGGEIAELQDAIGVTAAAFPKVTTVRVGVVAYSGEGLQTFPLTEMPASDGGAAATSVRSFLEKITLSGHDGDPATALREATEILEGGAENVRSLVLLLGDVDADLPVTFGPNSRQSVSEIETWATQPGQDHRAVAVFCGPPGSPEAEYFQALGAAGANSVFTARSGDIFPAVFSAAFSNPEIPE